jgi:hypothetical protein
MRLESGSVSVRIVFGSSRRRALERGSETRRVRIPIRSSWIPTPDVPVCRCSCGACRLDVSLKPESGSTAALLRTDGGPRIGTYFLGFVIMGLGRVSADVITKASATSFWTPASASMDTYCRPRPRRYHGRRFGDGSHARGSPRFAQRSRFDAHGF